MGYASYVVLVVVGYYTYGMLTSIRRLNNFFHYKCRNGVKDLIFYKMKVRTILPHWAYRYGGGPVPTWTWRVVLASVLLSPFWLLDWAGFQLNWGYVYSFVGGLVLAEIINEGLRYLAIKQFVQGTPAVKGAIENFIKANTR